jgi:hypothetical protein
MLKQHLHAQADAEEWFAGGSVFDHSGQTALIQLTHAVSHCANSGKNDATGTQNNVRVGCHYHAGGWGNMFERLGHRAQIAHAVVNDSDIDAHVRDCLWWKA